MMTSIDSNRSWLILIVLSLSLTGCKTEVCSSEDIDESRPTRDISCPTGKVCYGGECISACNAGSENFVSCEDDTGCTNPARPFCVNNFCSACEQTTYCVPSLNICAPVRLFDTGSTTPNDNEVPTAKAPLDAGPIDGAMFSTDSGVVEIEETPPTHVVTVDINQITEYSQGQVSSRASVDIESTDVSAATLIESATVAQSFVANTYRCDLKTLERYVGTSSAADIGEIGFGNSTGNMEADGLLGPISEYIASFAGNQYQLSSPVPNELLNFSTVEPPSLSYILFAAAGNSDLGIPAFPVGVNSLLHVPYEMTPGANANEGIDTAQDLRDGYRINRQTPTKLTFVWDFPRNVNGVRVLVRIVGANHQLICTATDQSERIEIVSRLLTQFANVEGISVGQIIPIYFERVFGTQFDVPIEDGKDTKLDFLLQIKHSHKSTLRYE